MLRNNADARRCSYLAAWANCAATRVLEVFVIKNWNLFSKVGGCFQNSEFFGDDQ